MSKKGKRLDVLNVENYKQLYEMTQKKPNAVAYEFNGKGISYKELIKNVELVARGLKSVNINMGDNVIVCLPDIPQAIECFYAMDKKGIHSYTLHSETKAPAIATIAEETNSTAIITIDKHYQQVSKAIAGMNHPVKVILADVAGKKIPRKTRKKNYLKKSKPSKYAKDEHVLFWSDLIKPR